MTEPTDTTAPLPGDTQAAIDAGVALADAKILEADGRLYAAVVPAGGKLTTIDTEMFALTPRRSHGVYRPADVDSFLTLFARHRDADDTTVWVHPDSGQVVAVFNDQVGDRAAWRDHRAVLQLIITDEWQHWLSRNGNLTSQTEFAHHVEDGLAELIEPAAADMLELAQTFQATQNASFRSAIRLQDGNVQTQYVEEQDAQAGQTGQLEIPSEFKLLLAPFRGEQPVELVARLRYRVTGGKLTIGYKLVQPEKVVRATLDAVADRIRQSHPAVYIGVPE